MGEDNRDQEEKQGFKVVDRRRFDSEGKERGVNEEPAKPPRSEPIKESPKMEEKSVAEEGAGATINFSSFVMSLATQALMQLGEVKSPEGVSVPVDKAAAQQTIDVLSMLELKTKGNLDKEEEYLITEILHNLRLRFVRKQS